MPAMATAPLARRRSVGPRSALLTVGSHPWRDHLERCSGLRQVTMTPEAPGAMCDYVTHAWDARGCYESG